MSELERCREEVVALHEFFVDWFTGTLEREAFERIERALAPEFVMVTPAAARRDRADVLSLVEEGYAGRPAGSFGIDIRNAELVFAGAECVIVSYEEWQRTPDGDTGRLSTAVFREDDEAPAGVAWVSLHETWIDDAAG